jgi:hypothetical protein
MAMQPRPIADTLGPFEPSNFVFMGYLLFQSVFRSGFMALPDAAVDNRIALSVFTVTMLGGYRKTEQCRFRPWFLWYNDRKSVIQEAGHDRYSAYTEKHKAV